MRLGEDAATAGLVVFSWAFALYPVYAWRNLRVWHGQDEALQQQSASKSGEYGLLDSKA